MDTNVEFGPVHSLDVSSTVIITLIDTRCSVALCHMNLMI